VSRVGSGIGALGGVDVLQVEGAVLGFEVFFWGFKFQTFYGTQTTGRGKCIAMTPCRLARR